MYFCFFVVRKNDALGHRFHRKSFNPADDFKKKEMLEEENAIPPSLSSAPSSSPYFLSAGWQGRVV